MTTKVIFVEPRGVKANVFSRYLNLPLMGPVYLASQLQKSNIDVRIYNENILGRDISLSELEADVFCLSAITPTIERGYEIARKFKAKNPKSRVIIGGIHASFSPEEALNFADHVVVGEGEEVLPELIKYGSSEKIIYGTRVKNLDATAFPDFSLIRNNKKMKITPVMASRGCPFACNFCTVTKMFGRKYRTVSIDRIIMELEQVKTRKVFFYDDNFAANLKRTDDLLERILKLKKKIKWTAQVRTDITKHPELVEKMAASGCKWVYVGFESINDESLKTLRKSQNLEDIKRSINIFHQSGISIHGMFMFGSDPDKKDDFQNTVDFCNRMRIDSVQYLVLTPFPGTNLYDDLKKQGRIVHKMWQYYDTMHAVFLPKNMTPSELQNGMYRSFDNFYSFSRLINDSFGAGIFLIIKLFNRVFLLGRRYKIMRRFHFFLHFVARRIVIEWGTVNKEYFQYLLVLKLPEETSCGEKAIE